ncbi:MAG: deoxyguanosinetriphosphate triphosphohydrolase [Caldilineaceae bacterium]|nr:deoxyguanosinetriphosphate triphosphohydrolase [Caldilineaceae bacterium]MBP8106086.1 deoxyguanosinetriphosphate triphosphohydrolase [Caldilineaceae bacterium]MBP8124965.1 deoxyguanosinetriphosphate triphosphohydrolase [Caldilineaceae bacterium]MBP9074704.1 deoxyguanosinetriphosphate triphosphohydrolase [Caldilineaceae bacterium]
MFITREELEKRENETLAAYAMRSGDSQGRAHPEAEPAYRTAYQRDRDRVIHTTAFRRLEYKTQVFVYSEGDHYRNRLTHSVEVAQIGRTMARTLGANEDLIEAVCLAHDLGHPPFGHTGETTLNALMANHGGYDHQKQTYRILTELEHRYPDYPGLNLTYEVREGVVKHDTDYDVVDARTYSPDEKGTLECQLSNLADEIAYSTSDLDDGLRSGILNPKAVLDLQIGRRVVATLDLDGPADLADTLTRHRFIRRMVGLIVQDAISATHLNMMEAKVETLADLRALPDNVSGYSPVMAVENAELKRFLYANFYRHYRVVRMAFKADRIIRQLFGAYIEEPAQLPTETQRRADESGLGLHRTLCDYLAGMTDRYAVQEHRRLFDPEERV